MKKIFTLVVGLFSMAAVFAADRRPSVTINNSKNYEIVIDGKTYSYSSGSMTFSTVFSGRHNVQVFELRKGLFVKSKKLVSTSSFQLGMNDVVININWMGQISVQEMKNRGGWNDHDQNDDRGFGKGYDKGRDQGYQQPQPKQPVRGRHF